MTLCPCCSEKEYVNCCARFIEGQQIPVTPEELMRSRYTAYTQANIPYIIRTMKSPAADNFDAQGAREWAERVTWLKLEIVNSSQHDAKGFVEFIVNFSQQNKKHILHELSEFHLEDGQWYYVDGEDPRAKLPYKVSHIGRNEPCLCGSGKKYKKCCGNAM